MVDPLASLARLIGPPVALGRDAIVVRARRVRLVLTDCDGVLTDQGVYYSERGEELKRFSIRDGMGVARLRGAGIATAIITGERSASVKRRAEKLNIEAFLGVNDKAAHLEEVRRAMDVNLDQIAFIGDDVNDLGLIAHLRPEGLCAAPADAMPVVAEAVHYHCQTPGGQGAFRELAEWLLDARA